MGQKIIKGRSFTVENNSSPLLEKVGSKLIFLCNYELKKLDLDLPPVYVNNMARSETNVPPNKQRYSWRNIVEQ